MKGRAIVRADGGFQAAICMSGSVEAESMACSAVVSCLPYSLALATCTFDRGRAETGAQNKGTYWVAGPARLVIRRESRWEQPGSGLRAEIVEEAREQ